MKRMGFNEGPLRRTKFGNVPTTLWFWNKDITFKSKLEANWALYLDLLKNTGKIRNWEYEPDRCVFKGETMNPREWTPDFKVTENDGTEVYHECKGAMTGRVNSKARKFKDRWDNDLWLIFQRIGKKKAANLHNAKKYFTRIVDAEKEIFKSLRGIIDFV